MADLNQELEALLTTFAEADRPAARDLFLRNQAAQSYVQSRESVYSAFIDGDTARIQQVTQQQQQQQPPAQQQQQPPQQTQQQQQQQPLSLGLDQINALLDARVQKVYTSPEFTAAVDAAAEKKAKTLFEAERTNVIGRSAEISDEITRIRESHLREFNEPLDSAAFKEFYGKEGPKYGNGLTATYDAFVGEKRIAKRIADGVAAGLAAAATNNVPGASVPTTNNPMAPNFVDHNLKIITPAGSATPPASADADKAAQAFAAMRGNWQM